MVVKIQTWYLQYKSGVSPLYQPAQCFLGGMNRIFNYYLKT